MKDKLKKVLEEKLGKEVFTEDLLKELQAHNDLIIEEKVNTLVESKVKLIEEKYAKDAKEYKAELVEQLDGWLDHVAEEYLKENKVAIQNEYTVKAADELIEKICEVLENNHYKVEPAKNKSIDRLTQENKDLKKKLSEAAKQILEKKQEVIEYKKARIVEGIMKEKKLSEKSRKEFIKVVEGTAYNDLKDFKLKCGILAEKFESKTPVIEKKGITPKDTLTEKKETKTKQTEELF